VRARRWVSRHRTFVTASGAALCVGVVILSIALFLLNQANEREKELRGVAENQKAKAEENFQLARLAVDQYFTQVSREVLLNEPGMDELRKKLLATARKFYQQFADQRTDDPAVRRELGQSLYRLALITADVEGREPAIEQLKEALAILGPLQDPESSDTLADL